MATTIAPGVACWPAPTQSVTPGRALFAKGLAKGCTSAHLQAIFSTFGTVTDCQIARHRSGRSAGFAIVTFLRHEEAVAAMQAVDNLMFMGRRLSVKWFSPERALEGSSHGVEALNMQALQHALQLSQLQPADLMAQLAQMLESPRIPQQQPQNPHVSAWLDNFVLAQQRDSPLAQPIPEAAQPQAPIDLLSFSALSLAEVPGAALGVPTAPGLMTHPATPSSLDVPDGAVFVTAGIHPAGVKGGNASIALAHSRLSKWCAAPGSAGGQSSAAPSLADDASSDETASVHASDDSSIATTVQIQHVSCDAPSCCTEGTSPSIAAVLTETPAAAAAATAVTATATTTATASPAVTAAASPVAAAAAPAIACSIPQGPSPMAVSLQAPGHLPAATVGGALPESEDVLRQRALAAAAVVMTTRPGVIGSDPGATLTQPVIKRPSGPSYTGAPPPPVLPGAPPLAPLRTVATAPATTLHHHHHHHHLSRSAAGPQRASAAIPPPFTSCGGGGASAAAASPEACLQQALRLQQALAEQARTMTAQQQYVDALAKLAAARDQVMAAASLLNNSNGAMAAAASLQMPPALAQHHHMPPPSLMAPHHPHHHHHHPMAAPMNPFMAAQAPQASGPVPDLGALLMFQNAAAMNRPLY